MPISNVKIMVLKKLSSGELLEQYGNNVAPECQLVEVGEEHTSENLNQPAGFCPWAWGDIRQYALHLAFGVIIQ
jgi:uncharacterized repeat protein (TIGR04076 family)